MYLSKVKFKSALSVAALFFLMTLYSFHHSDQVNNIDWDKYLKSYKVWKKQRVANLKKPMGYLSMTGLFWLKEGSQSLGSAVENDIIFPSDFPSFIGILQLDDNILSFYDNKDSLPQRVHTDIETEPTVFNWKSNYWYAIKRGDQYGIRLKDTLSESRLSFESIPAFDPSPDWIIKGRYTKSDEGSNLSITNKVGITYDSKFAGTVSFFHNEKRHELLATFSGDRLFIVFADYTNGTETYGGGRFLYVDIPKEGIDVVLDFNKVENPICAFSDFATCPLPRPENYLTFVVNAGEKKVRD